MALTGCSSSQQPPPVSPWCPVSQTGRPKIATKSFVVIKEPPEVMTGPFGPGVAFPTLVAGANQVSVGAPNNVDKTKSRNKSKKMAAQTIQAIGPRSLSMLDRIKAANAMPKRVHN